MVFVTSQSKVCEIICQQIWLRVHFLNFSQSIDKYHLSIEIDIERLVAYAHKKMDLNLGGFIVVCLEEKRIR